MYFSIIVPVYKVEKYLHQCVDSVLNQTCSDYELILVDDGSTDECPRICDEFAEKDARVKVVHKENGGLSDARNCGVSITSGEYVIFLDSDDYWEDIYALAKLKAIIENVSCDVLLFRRKKLSEITGVFTLFGKNVDSDCTFSQLINSRNFVSSANSKVIKRDLFIKGDLSFELGVYSEDVEWSARLLLLAEKIVPSNLDFYIYRQREGSITHTIGEKNVENLKSHIEKIITHIANAPDEKKEMLRIYCAEEFTNYFVTVSGYSNRLAEMDWIKKQKKILKWSSSKRSKMLRMMLNVIGVKMSLWLIRKIR